VSKAPAKLEPFKCFAGLLTVIYLVLATAAHAEVMFNDSRLWRRAKLVNASQQVWSFQSSYQKTTDRFGTSGRVESLGAKYSRDHVGPTFKIRELGAGPGGHAKLHETTWGQR